MISGDLLCSGEELLRAGGCQRGVANFSILWGLRAAGCKEGKAKPLVGGCEVTRGKSPAKGSQGGELSLSWVSAHSISSASPAGEWTEGSIGVGLSSGAPGGCLR